MLTKKLYIFSALTASTLFTSAALADDPVYVPCTGNYGLSYPQRCTPPAPEVPDEAFAPAPVPVYVEVAPTPAPAPAPAVPATPCYEPPATNLTPPTNPYQNWSANRLGSAERVRELGVRSYQGDGVGGSLYFRTHKASSRVGLELSIDGVENVAVGQASVVAYSRHKGAIQPFLFVGGGVSLEEPGYSFQAGAGADLALTPRLSLTGDLRLLATQSAVMYEVADCFDCFYEPQDFNGALASLGLSWKIGAIGTPGTSLLQNQPLRNNWSSPGARLGARYNQSYYGQNRGAYGAQGGLLPNRWSAPSGVNGRTRELGVRSYVDLAYGDADGGGIYYKTAKQGGYLGVELSADDISGMALLQGAVMGYLNPNGLLRPYALIGGGIDMYGGLPVSQGGFGADLKITERVSLNSDIRVINGQSGDFVTCTAIGCPPAGPSETVVGSFGVGWRY